MVTSLNRIVSRPGTSCPTFHVEAETSVALQMNPPRLGPSATRMIGWSPHTLTVQTAYPLSRVLDGWPPATPPVARARCHWCDSRRTPIRLELRSTLHGWLEENARS